VWHYRAENGLGRLLPPHVPLAIAILLAEVGHVVVRLDKDRVRVRGRGRSRVIRGGRRDKAAQGSHERGRRGRERGCNRASKGVGKRPPPTPYLACRPCTVGLYTVGWRLLRHRVRALCAARWA